MTDERANKGRDRSPARVQARVGLTLLEALRDLDLPDETFEDENLYTTMPRRFGVSRVLAAQLHRYEEASRSGERMSDEEVVDLVRLVIRRPDSEEIFSLAGERLAGPAERGRSWRYLPQRLRRGRVARELRRSLRRLFGRPFARTSGVPLTLETREELLVRGDPGGEACVLLTGFLRAKAGRHLGEVDEVLHPECMARGHARCLWVVAFPEDRGTSTPGSRGARAGDEGPAEGEPE